MKKYSNIFLLLLFVLFSACSSSDDSQGVISANDLSSDTTVTTIAEDVVEEVVSVEDAQLLLARCLRENGYDITDPKNGESLRSVIGPILLAADQKGREELQETIQICAEENNTPLGGTAEFENPEAVADALDTQLEFAQCLRENGIEIEDPSAESPLRPLLFELVQSGQYLQTQIQEAAEICFDDLGIDPPQQGGG
jgi:hypothetical protein|tara:strand:- start:99 stop:689 length:591 start_codon:yes stop_codon:yes gene_type:complete